MVRNTVFWIFLYFRSFKIRKLQASNCEFINFQIYKRRNLRMFETSKNFKFTNLRTSKPQLSQPLTGCLNLEILQLLNLEFSKCSKSYAILKFPNYKRTFETRNSRVCRPRQISKLRETLRSPKISKPSNLWTSKTFDPLNLETPKFASFPAFERLKFKDAK